MLTLPLLPADIRIERSATSDAKRAVENSKGLCVCVQMGVTAHPNVFVFM